MSNEITFKIVTVNKTLETFEVEWEAPDGTKNTVNYELPINMQLDNVTEEMLVEYISSTMPRDIRYFNRELNFPGETLESLRTKKYSVTLDNDDNVGNIEEEDV